jgi:hypothetical protein
MNAYFLVQQEEPLVVSQGFALVVSQHDPPELSQHPFFAVTTTGSGGFTSLITMMHSAASKTTPKIPFFSQFLFGGLQQSPPSQPQSVVLFSFSGPCPFTGISSMMFQINKPDLNFHDKRIGRDLPASEKIMTQIYVILIYDWTIYD